MRKKLFSILLSICMLAHISALPAYAQSTNTFQNSDYVKYNLETGTATFHSFDDLPDATGGATSAYSPGYYPNGVVDINLASPATIVDTDDRTRVNPTTVGPYCNTVYLHITFPNGHNFVASGFVIGPSAVATAAHCVYNNSYGGVASSVLVVPAKNGVINPYGSETVTSDNIVVSGLYAQSSSYQSDHDWAIIELNSDLGNQTGWLGLQWKEGSYNNIIVYCTGYPDPYYADAQNEDSTYMLVGSGRIKHSDTYILYGDYDATGGDSGGPVFAYYYNTGYTAIGIHTAGPENTFNGSSYPDSFSSATRFTDSLYSLLVSYRTSPYPQ